MHEQTSQDIVQGVDSGAADLGIIAGRVSTRGLEVYRFREDRLVAVVHENHRLATDKPVRFYQLLDYDFIGLGDRASVQIWLTKQALVPHGIPMPGGRIVTREELYARDPLPRPYVLKPVNEGSSVGVAIVTDDGNYGNPIAPDAVGPWQEFEELLAEPFIRGRELTTAVLGDEALGVTELKPKSGFYDYDAKYTDGMTEHVYPAEIPDEITAACMKIARDAHRILGCKGCSRSDFRWDDMLGREGLFLLEVNTQPGMTPLSLAPEQARHRGMAYADFVQRIVEEAL
jgi:D-alanine-D-alanine ligase